ncbi:MAG: DUF5916 domain-containing protein [Pyrinomonadaceae bacterium]
MRKLILAITAIFVGIVSAYGQGTDKFDLERIRADRKNPVTVPRFDAPPIIDGKLDEDVWKRAAKFENFVQTDPGDLIPPSRETIAYLGYDSKNLYIAFMCFDEPGSINYSVAKRDQVGGEDYVGVFFDTFDDQRKAYIFQFNPLGIQADGIRTAGEMRSDFSVDVVLESRGQILENGWSVEAKIPFKSLRYKVGKGRMWGIDFWRRITRFNREISDWIPMERGVPELQQLGKITGIEDIDTERTLEVVPSVTLSKSRERTEDPAAENGSRLVGQPFGKDLGVSIKYQITPNVTLDAAVNPDFAEIEADAPVVRANERFPIFFPEKRPFFLEGIDIFRSRLQVVNTRNIADPDVALKLTGKIGKNTFGVLGAVDNFSDTNQKAFAGVFRYRRDIGANSNIGAFATQYHLGSNLHNNLFGIDGSFQLDSRTVASFEVFGTASKRYFYEPEIDESIYRNGNGFAYRAELDYTGRNRGYNIELSGRSSDYRADLGFTRRTDSHGGRYGYRLQTEPAPEKPMIRFTHRGFFSASADSKGRIQDLVYNAFNSFDFQKQLNFNFRPFIAKEKIYENEFGAKRGPSLEGAFFGESYRSATQYGFDVELQKSFDNRLRLSAKYGLRANEFDFDFGASERFPRISPAYLQYLEDVQTNPDLETPPIDPGEGLLKLYSFSVEMQPTEPLNLRFAYDHRELRRNDNDRVAFDSNLFSFRSTYQFTRFISSRTRLDYNTVSGSLDTQLLFGWTPSPGTAFFAGYNDSSYYRGYNYFSNNFDPAFRRDNQAFFIRVSYLFRKSF